MRGIEIGRCWHCGHAILDTDVGRENRCSACDKPIHACRNCRFYAPGLHNDCSEPVADVVQDKLRANFCDYFKPHADAYGGTATDDAEALRQAAEDLFKT